MPLRELPVTQLMVTDVVTFTTDQNVQDAMRTLVVRDVDAGPVLDADGVVVGLFSTGDVIVEEARLHLPTVVNFLGVNVALPWHDKDLDESVAKALGEYVGDVMTAPAITLGADATVEDAATLMHDEHVSRLPIVDGDGQLVGLIARGDIVRAIVLGLDEPDEATPLPEDDFTEMLEARAEETAEAGDDTEQG